MKIGKISKNFLEKFIINTTHNYNNKVIVPPLSEEDCCAVDSGNGYLTVSTTDTIISSKNLAGRVAINVACNDLAACGVKPQTVLSTMIVPATLEESQLISIINQLKTSAKNLKVDIVGGHTEISSAVDETVMTITAMGTSKKGHFVRTSGAKIGDVLIMTKSAGIEGTFELAFKKEIALSEEYGSYYVTNAKKFIKDISVVNEGLLAASMGVHAMHDASSGGILDCVFEMSKSAGNGITIYKDKIPVNIVTQEICNFYNINPYRLRSGGSMLIACSNTKAKKIISRFAELNIKACVIGEFNNSSDRIMVTDKGGIIITAPTQDEIYKVI